MVSLMGKKQLLVREVKTYDSLITVHEQVECRYIKKPVRIILPAYIFCKPKLI